MGTIVERTRKNGDKAYMAKIVLVREGKVVHRESETFDRRGVARAWIEKREDALNKPGALDRAKVSANDPLLSEVIDRYIAESEKAMGKTKAQVLRTVKTLDIAKMRCSDITSTAITEFAKALDSAPSTRLNYLSHLSSIFAIAGPMWGYPLTSAVMQEALIVLRRMGITGKSNKRDRRPTVDELDRIMTFYHERETRRPHRKKMTRLIAFALFSTRRQEEICTIKWADLEEEHSRVMVRDMKNPGEKIGNDVWCDLPEPALRIIKATPRASDRIFPLNHRSVSIDFTHACQVLGIEDLHFHDLRHEGISWLVETGHGGGSIPHIAAVSGHRSWSSLQRYTHVKQRGDKYANWKWLDVVAPPVTDG